MRWLGYVAHVGDRRVAYRVLMGKPEGNTLLGGPRFRLDDNIKIDLQEVGWGLELNWPGLG
jgi:hypothetical protein